MLDGPDRDVRPTVLATRPHLRLTLLSPYGIFLQKHLGVSMGNFRPVWDYKFTMGQVKFIPNTRIVLAEYLRLKKRFEPDVGIKGDNVYTLEKVNLTNT